VSVLLRQAGRFEDLSLAVVVVDPDYLPVTDSPDHAVHPDGFVRWLEDWDEPWEEWSMEAERWIDAGDQVVLIFRMTTKGRGSGVEINTG
jgi:hypothetical protein